MRPPACKQHLVGSIGGQENPGAAKGATEVVDQLPKPHLFQAGDGCHQQVEAALAKGALPSLELGCIGKAARSIEPGGAGYLQHQVPCVPRLEPHLECCPLQVHCRVEQRFGQVWIQGCLLTNPLDVPGHNRHPGESLQDKASGQVAQAVSMNQRIPPVGHQGSRQVWRQGVGCHRATAGLNPGSIEIQPDAGL